MLRENYNSGQLNPQTPRLLSLSHRTIKIEIFEDEQAVAQMAASLLATQIAAKLTSVLLLPTGRTPLLMYDCLVDLVKQSRLNLSRVKSFNLDEFYGIAPEHPGSYHQYMQKMLFGPAAMPAANTQMLNGAASDPVRECAEYEAKIQATGGVDVAVLGIGANGHIGFNEPGSSFDSRTHQVSIRSETRSANAFLFNDNLQAVPETALTVGIATIMDAQRILLLATGQGKASAIAAMLNGPVTEMLPASCLQNHPDVTLLLDKSAASQFYPLNSGETLAVTLP